MAEPKRHYEMVKLPLAPYRQALELADYLQEPLEVIVARSVAMLHTYHTLYRNGVVASAPLSVDLDLRIKSALLTYGTREGSFDQLFREFLHVKAPGETCMEELFKLYRSGAPYVNLLLGGPGKPALRGSYWRFDADARTHKHRPPIATVIKEVLDSVRGGAPRRRATEWIEELVPPVNLHGYTPEGILFTASCDPDPRGPVLRYRLKHPPLYSIRYPGWDDPRTKTKKPKPRRFLDCIRNGKYYPATGDPVKIIPRHVAAAMLTLQTGAPGPHPELAEFTNAHCELLIKSCGDEKLVEMAVRESIKHTPLEFDMPEFEQTADGGVEPAL